MGRRSSNQIVVPNCKAALNQMKYEIAAELGLYQSTASGAGEDTEFAGELGAYSGGGHGAIQWSNLTSREVGSVGGSITKRLVSQAEAVLRGYQ
ncbi:alpha/beta-type small acid-soluble spore protein [Paenibacillus gorillae]|uniref:alpha/beta-type small acid-soluble spore protein n=1 Tax=Paenibacillus gorillae TaxID=1243662 RepID=UPI0004B2FE4D|nr:alpha/beta-type small acid-soluble spore protein [Paenibacillus gorillae]